MTRKRREYPVPELLVLAAALKDPTVLPRVLAEAPVEAFADEDLRLIRRELDALLRSGADKYDLVGRFRIIQRRLPKSPSMKETLETLWTECQWMGSTAVDADLQALAEAALSRSLFSGLKDILERHRQKKLSAHEAILEAVRYLSLLAGGREADRIYSGEEWIELGVEDFEATAKKAERGEALWWDLGMPEFSEDVALEPPKYLLLAVQTGVGKSTIALHWAVKLAVLGDTPVLYLNTEMTVRDIVRRVMAILSGVPLSDLQKGRAADRRDQFMGAADRYRKNLLSLSDAMPGLNLTKIEALIVRYQAERGIKAVVVDYIQNLLEAQSRPGMPAWEALADVSRQLKILAKRYGIAVIATAQLNKAGDLQGAKAMADDVDAFYSLWSVGSDEHIERIPQEWRRYAVDCAKAGASHVLLPSKNRHAPHRVFGVDLPLSSLAREVLVIDPSRRSVGAGAEDEMISIDEALARIPPF